jgi:hypothetical protein
MQIVRKECIIDSNEELIKKYFFRDIRIIYMYSRDINTRHYGSPMTDRNEIHLFIIDENVIWTTSFI